jgi:hypothetical protein
LRLKVLLPFLTTRYASSKGNYAHLYVDTIDVRTYHMTTQSRHRDSGTLLSISHIVLALAHLFYLTYDALTRDGYVLVLELSVRVMMNDS